MTDLPTVLAEHARWLEDKSTGRRADLCGAKLTDAAVSETDLAGAFLA